MQFHQAIEQIRNKKFSFKVIDLSMGDPYVPLTVKEFLIEKVRLLANKEEISSIFSYSDYDGLKSFTKKFREAYKNIYEIELSDNEVIVTPGAQAALFYLQKYFTENKRKLLFPLDFEYQGANNFNKRRSQSYNLTNYLRGDSEYDVNFFEKINWGEIGAIFISQPHNPTTMLWSNKRLLELAKYIASYGVYLVVDETYAMPFAPLFVEDYQPAIFDNIMHIYSFSKIGLAGERVGIITGKNKVIKKLANTQREYIIQTSKIGQLLAEDLIEYYLRDSNKVKQFGIEYKFRYSKCTKILNDYNLIDEVIFQPVWGGGPFLWIQCKFMFSEIDFFHELLKAGLAIMPGSVFSINKSKSKLPAFRVGLGGCLNEILEGIRILAEMLLSEYRNNLDRKLN